jgi:hypothetical protein
VWRQYLDRFFPVNIETQEAGVLVIEDRRISDGLWLWVALAAGSIVFSAMIFRPSIASRLYWPLVLFLLPAPIFGVKSLLSTLREKYIFDKGRDTYTFTRRSALQSRTTQGSLSLIRAVQLERRTVRTEHETREIFRVALLLQQGLLLGASDTILLREDTALGSTYASEAQIAYAIANFLNLRVPETVDMGSS